VLFLTKPLGTGVVGTAIKSGRAPAELVAVAVGFMTTLNKAAAEALAGLAVHACTDITGFGLAGHGSEMAAASGVSLELDAGAIPLLEGVLPLVAGHRSGGMSSNRSHFGGRIHLGAGLSRDLQDLLFDPQTSGGLLVAVGAEDADQLARRFEDRGVPVHRVGRVTGPRPDAALITVP
jgi:selenide, water dikinase